MQRSLMEDWLNSQRHEEREAGEWQGPSGGEPLGVFVPQKLSPVSKFQNCYLKWQLFLIDYDVLKAHLIGCE